MLSFVLKSHITVLVVCLVLKTRPYILQTFTVMTQTMLLLSRILKIFTEYLIKSTFLIIMIITKHYLKNGSINAQNT